jgi:hypothetical protein
MPAHACGRRLSKTRGRRITASSTTYSSSAAFTRLSADAQAREVIETLRRIFEIGLEESDVQRQAFNARSPRLWLAIAARTDILGALALRLRRWELVREIGLWFESAYG